MPIAEAMLEATARAYVAPMSSIRGRRVHRLLMRELAPFDHVLAVTTDDGAPALLAIGADGRAAVCRTDGRGPAAAIAEWSRLQGATVTTAYDLARDSLTVVSWTIRHPSFADVARALTISAADLPQADRERIAEVLRTLGR